MAVLPILTYPHKTLREKADLILCVTDEVQKTIDDLAETMYAASHGMGLAAPQIGVSKRIFVIDTNQAGEKGGLKVFVNPIILRTAGSAVCEEGCLSFPGQGEKVQRAGCVAVTALDRDGKPFVLDAEGLLAVAIQHENDHLDGVLFIDHLSPITRDVVKRKMMRRQKAMQRGAGQRKRP